MGKAVKSKRIWNFPGCELYILNNKRESVTDGNQTLVVKLAVSNFTELCRHCGGSTETSVSKCHALHAHSESGDKSLQMTNIGTRQKSMAWSAIWTRQCWGRTLPLWSIEPLYSSSWTVTVRLNPSLPNKITSWPRIHAESRTTYVLCELSIARPLFVFWRGYGPDDRNLISGGVKCFLRH